MGGVVPSTSGDTGLGKGHLEFLFTNGRKIMQVWLFILCSVALTGFGTLPQNRKPESKTLHLIWDPEASFPHQEDFFFFRMQFYMRWGERREGVV